VPLRDLIRSLCSQSLQVKPHLTDFADPLGVTLCRERPDVRELHEPALDGVRRYVENDTSEVVRGRIGPPRDVAGSVAAAPNRVFWPRGGEHRFSEHRRERRTGAIQPVLGQPEDRQKLAVSL
jgi:hypothetical protein